MRSPRIALIVGFLSTLSLRRATRIFTNGKQLVHISIHALLAESDLAVPDLCKRNIRFLSTLSLRRATKGRAVYLEILSDFYPRSPCGERLKVGGIDVSKVPISIHALLAESDRQYKMLKIECNISIHALLAESDRPTAQLAVLPPKFLSTLSLRRATGDLPPGVAGRADFYPRSPCGERRDGAYFAKSLFSISIHALLAESD